MNLVYHEIPEWVVIDGEQKRPWYRWQGEMDELVKRQAEDMCDTPDNVYLIIENMLGNPRTPFSLLIDTDKGLLRGFLGFTIVPPNIAVNFCAVQRGVGVEAYAPVLNKYIDDIGIATGCSKKIFLVNHAIRYSFKDNFRKNDPVTRICKRLGTEPRAVMYAGEIPTKPREGDDR